MTRQPAGGGRLIAGAVILAAAGTLLLCVGISGDDLPTRSAESQARPRTSQATATRTDGVLPVEAGRATRTPGAAERSPAPAGSVGAQPAGGRSASTSPDLAGALPPPDSGPAADPLIQQALDQATPPDLPPDIERRLLALGRAAWEQETARYTQVRIQAATASRDTTPVPSPSTTPGAGTGTVAGAAQVGRAVVRLVWAGADPAGTFLDGRPAAVHFTQNGDGTWTRT